MSKPNCLLQTFPRQISSASISSYTPVLLFLYPPSAQLSFRKHSIRRVSHSLYRPTQSRSKSGRDQSSPLTQSSTDDLSSSSSSSSIQSPSSSGTTDSTNQSTPVYSSSTRRILALLQSGDIDLAEAIFKLETAARNKIQTELSPEKEDEELKLLGESLVFSILNRRTFQTPSASTFSFPSVDDRDATLFYASPLTRRVIHLLHFFRIHRVPRTEHMYKLLLGQLLDDGDIDIAARVYTELVEEWAWEARLGRTQPGSDQTLATNELTAEVNWLRRPSTAPSSPSSDSSMAGPKLSGGIDSDQARRQKEEIEEKDLLGFWGLGLRWNHRAEAQRRAMCWAPEPTRVNLYLQRFPSPPPSQTAPGVEPLLPELTPFPSQELLDLILAKLSFSEVAHPEVFQKSAAALAILSNTVLARTLPLFRITSLIKALSSLPKHPTVYPPIPSPDKVDNTSAYAHVQGALSSLIWGLPGGSMDVNATRYGLHFVSETSARTLLWFSLSDLKSPLGGQRVLRYMQGQGWADKSETGLVLMEGGLATKVWNLFLDGLKGAVGSLTAGILELFHTKPDMERPEIQHLVGSSQFGLPVRRIGELPKWKFDVEPSDEHPSALIHSRPFQVQEYDEETNAYISSVPTKPFELLDPHLVQHFDTLISSSAYTADHLSRLTVILIRYGVSTRRFDIVTQITNYLLRQSWRPIQMNRYIYHALFNALVSGGLFRTAEQIFCLAREEASSHGTKLSFGFHRDLLELYAAERKLFFGGKAYPGETVRGNRALTSGWALYRGIMRGDWADWEEVQTRILSNTRFKRIASVPSSNRSSKVLSQTSLIDQASRSTERSIVSDDPIYFLGTNSPEIVRPLRLQNFFNAALSLFYVCRSEDTVPDKFLLNPKTFESLLHERQQVAQSFDSADEPDYAVEDEMLTMVAQDVVRARLPLPPGIEYHLSRYPSFLEKLATLRETVVSSPSFPAQTDELNVHHKYNPYRLVPARSYFKGSLQVYEQEAMDNLASSPEFFSPTDPSGEPYAIHPSDWPLLVWAALKGRTEAEYGNLPPGLWAEAQLFSQSFEVSKSDRYLLLVGRVGKPVPFIPKRHREEFLQGHWPSLRKTYSVAAALERLGDLGWWPGCQKDFIGLKWKESGRGRSVQKRTELKQAVEAIELGSLDSLKEIAQNLKVSID
ncbi:hypothetical protein [Phaffia rhodozyma]|uniref:Uncharacterized protein n=1 Tax=Phaffia rhodozyma TaxID=264483 RepID=A0A0F7SN72_PHARH|nr:hypothetical protein [Phaffia rhodozyma]